jgi:hypothetical protein
MDYTEEIEWFPKDYDDFEKTFGFSRYERQPIENGNFSVRTDINGTANIEDYDFFIEAHISNYDYGEELKKYEFEKNNEIYNLLLEEEGENTLISVYDQNNNEIVSINSKDIINQFENYNLTSEMIPVEDAYVKSENGKVAISILVQYIEADKNDEGYDFNAEIYIFIKVE